MLLQSIGAADGARNETKRNAKGVSRLLGRQAQRRTETAFD